MREMRLSIFLMACIFEKYDLPVLVPNAFFKNAILHFCTKTYFLKMRFCMFDPKRIFEKYDVACLTPNAFFKNAILYVCTKTYFLKMRFCMFDPKRIFEKYDLTVLTPNAFLKNTMLHVWLQTHFSKIRCCMFDSKRIFSKCVCDVWLPSVFPNKSKIYNSSVHVDNRIFTKMHLMFDFAFAFFSYFFCIFFAFLLQKCKKKKEKNTKKCDFKPGVKIAFLKNATGILAQMHFEIAFFLQFPVAAPRQFAFFSNAANSFTTQGGAGRNIAVSWVSSWVVLIWTFSEFLRAFMPCMGPWSWEVSGFPVSTWFVDSKCLQSPLTFRCHLLNPLTYRVWAFSGACLSSPNLFSLHGTLYMLVFSVYLQVVFWIIAFHKCLSAFVHQLLRDACRLLVGIGIGPVLQVFPAGVRYVLHWSCVHMVCSRPYRKFNHIRAALYLQQVAWFKTNKQFIDIVISLVLSNLKYVTCSHVNAYAF